MQYDPKIKVQVPGEKANHGYGYMQLSQLKGLSWWPGNLHPVFFEQLLRWDTGEYFILQKAKDYQEPKEGETWAYPPDDPSGYDPNYQIIELTPLEAIQWFQSHGLAVPVDLAETTNPSNDNRIGQPQDNLKMDQVWNPDAPDYVPASDAIESVKFNLSPSRLSKLLTPSGPIRYMRRGRRCSVHIVDFMRWAKTQGQDLFSDEVWNKHMADADAQMNQIRSENNLSGK